jgi:hypothetical protein
MVSGNQTVIFISKKPYKQPEFRGVPFTERLFQSQEVHRLSETAGNTQAKKKPAKKQAEVVQQNNETIVEIPLSEL